MEHNLPDLQRDGDLAVIADIIEDLNVEFYERTGLEWIHPFEVRTIGSMHVVEFMGQNIWDSENDERPYTDEEGDVREPLETYIIRQAVDMSLKLTDFLLPKGAKCWRCDASLSRKDD